MLVIPAIFSLLVAAAGWFYLFYSRAARNLAGIEQEARNRLRMRLRRAGGIAMIALAVCFYIACDALVRKDLELFSGLMLFVLLLLMVILALGLFDLRMTRQLRRNQENLKP